MALLNRTFFFSLLCSFAICRSFVFFFPHGRIAFHSSRRHPSSPLQTQRETGRWDSCRTQMSDRSTSGSMLGTRLKLSPNEQEIMELNQRISANLESVRHSVGGLQPNTHDNTLRCSLCSSDTFLFPTATQVQFIDSVQSDLARAHELVCSRFQHTRAHSNTHFAMGQLHAFMVTEGKNKVNVYKRQLSRLHKSLEFVAHAENHFASHNQVTTVMPLTATSLAETKGKRSPRRSPCTCSRR